MKWGYINDIQNNKWLRLPLTHTNLMTWNIRNCGTLHEKCAQNMKQRQYMAFTNAHKYAFFYTCPKHEITWVHGNNEQWYVIPYLAIATEVLKTSYASTLPLNTLAIIIQTKNILHQDHHAPHRYNKKSSNTRNMEIYHRGKNNYILNMISNSISIHK